MRCWWHGWVFPLSLPAKSSQSPMEAMGNYRTCSEHRWGKEQPTWEARRGPDKARSRCKCATCSVDKSTQPIGNRDKQLLPLSACTQPEDSPAFLIARQSPSMLAFFPWRPHQYFFFFFQIQLESLTDTHAHTLRFRETFCFQVIKCYSLWL